ncbi:phage portal protein [Streptomyces sp. NPDC055085]
MPNIWSSLFRGRSEERLTQDDWAQQWMNYQGLGYPVKGYGGAAGSKTEQVGNDFEGYVQGAYKANGIVYACMTARRHVFSQVRFQWQQMRNGQPGDLFGTRELSVLEQPWPGASTMDLLNRAIQHADLAGNHYAYREGGRIRWLRPDWVDIILTAPPDEATEADRAGWLYRPGGTEDRDKWKMFAVGDHRFAHWAPDPDPEAQFRGMSWLTPIIREIEADKAATKHKGNFFKNAATPALSVSLKETVTEAQFKAFIKAMDESHKGSDNAYSTLYLGGGADVKTLTHDMNQLDFKNTQGAGETRIAAAARVHPVIVGLSEGMQGSSLNAGNFKAAKDGFSDGTMAYLWQSLCGAYASLVQTPSDARLWHDPSGIPFLQDDIEQKAKVQTLQAQAIGQYVMQGWEPVSSRDAVLNNDMGLLKPTGLVSVQLFEPGQGPTSGTTAPAENKPAPNVVSQKGAGKQPAPVKKTPPAA